MRCAAFRRSAPQRTGPLYGGGTPHPPNEILMKLLKVQIIVDLDLDLADHIDPEWVEENCVNWKDSWRLNDMPGVSCVSARSGVASSKLINNGSKE